MKDALAEAEETLAEENLAGSSGGGFGGMFGPEFMGKLAIDPVTRGYLQQPDFKAMIQVSIQPLAGPTSRRAPPYSA